MCAMEVLHATLPELESPELALRLGMPEPLMVMPCIDVAMGRRAAVHAAGRAGAPGLLLVLHDQARLGFVAVLNAVFRASASPWVGYMAQDAFAGRQWLSLALCALESRQAGLLGFNDGKWQGQLASFGLARRSWIESLYCGDFFYGGYRRHYADAELTLIAREQGRYVYQPDSVLVEVDWCKDSAAVDAQDRALFAQRRIAGFDGRVLKPELLNLMR